jgi:hypothetical protein
MPFGQALMAAYLRFNGAVSGVGLMPLRQVLALPRGRLAGRQRQRDGSNDPSAFWRRLPEDGPKS